MTQENVQQPQQQININDLFVIIGRQTFEVEALKGQIINLQAELEQIKTQKSA